jgi:hypothetical protein
MKPLDGVGAEDDRNISRKGLPRLLRVLARAVGAALFASATGILPANENALSAAPTRLLCLNFVLFIITGVPEALAAECSFEAEDRYVPERAALLCARADGKVGMSEYFALAGACVAGNKTP